MCFVWFSLWTAIISFHNIYQFIFVMVTRCVFFEVRTEFFKYLDELRHFYAVIYVVWLSLQ
jgi:hypothetical protein